MIDQLAKSDQLDVLEVGSGTGNLAETIVNNSRLKIDYLGLEVDDLLIDLSASIADVMESSVVFAQGDAVASQVLKESDLIVSDLPIGYYPDDAIAQRYQGGELRRPYLCPSPHDGTGSEIPETSRSSHLLAPNNS